MSRTKSTYGKGRLLAALAVVSALAVTSQGTAHASVTPLLSNQASTSGIVYDSAILGNGLNPTGALTFTLFGPEDPTCAGKPVFITTTKVNGNGYYESARFVATVAGTYRWIAVYGGDANNTASRPTLCSDPAGQVVVGKRQPQLSASPDTSRPSSADTAVLSAALLPTGTITFRLYGPDNMTCAGAPVFTSKRTVIGNGSYTSDGSAPTAPGTYRWLVDYSGDAGNFAKATICSDTNGFAVARPALAVVSANPTTVSRGGTVTVAWSGVAAPTTKDWVALYRIGVPDGGLVTKWAYTTGTASGSVALKFPWGASAGSYEVRLMANGTTQRLATSSPINLAY